MDKTILLQSIKTRRKCSICKEFVCLEDEFDNILYYGTTMKNKKLQHKKCLKKKMLSKNSNKLSELDADIIIEDLFKDGSSHIDNIIYKNQLYIYLLNHYNIVQPPTYLYTKMEQVFAGTFERKGIRIKNAIQPGHLLDMWQRKQSFLDGLYHKEKIDGVGRINYDLAVLIAKYPGYLDWLGKKESDSKKIVEYTIQNEGIGLTTMVSNKFIKSEDEDIFEE